MAKEIKGYVKLTIPAAKANPAPPVGPALGQQGLNIQEFCKQFNDATKDMEPGTPTPVVITAYTDRTFDFIMRLPPVSYFIKKALNAKKGGAKPGRESIGTLTSAQIRKIAETKMPDLNCSDVEAAMNIVAGQCRSMGVKVEG